MTYLLDTGIISELSSLNPNPQLVQWLDSLPEEMVFISALTLADITERLKMEKSPTDRDNLSSWLANDLLVRFGGRVCEITVEVSLKWGEVIAKYKTLMRKLSLSESLNLAIALVYGHILVSRDTSVFKDAGVKTINPFE
jgi:predicted nucleic acid-binding protein